MYRMIRLFLCLLVAATASQAQEPDRPEDILQYFPEGIYTFVRHSDMTDVRDREAYAAYVWFHGKTLARGRSTVELEPEQLLPESLGKNVVSHTHAKFVIPRYTRLPDPTQATPESYRRRAIRGMKENSTDMPIFGRDEDGRNITIIGYFSDEGEDIYVFRFDALVDLLAEAEKNGAIAATGESINAMPVYAFEMESQRWRGRSATSAVAVPTGSGELLMAKSVDMLRRMCAAGQGATLGMLDQGEYFDAFSMIPDLGHTWTIRFQGAIAEMQLRSFEMQDLSEAALKTVRARHENQPLFSVTSSELDDTIISRLIIVYRDDEEAAEAYEESNIADSMYLNSPWVILKPLREIFQLKTEHSTRELQGNRIISITSIDRAYMKQHIALWKDLQDEMLMLKKAQMKNRKQKQQQARPPR